MYDDKYDDTQYTTRPLVNMCVVTPSHNVRPEAASKLLHSMAVAGATSAATPFHIDPESEAYGLDHLLNNRWVLSRQKPLGFCCIV